MTYSERRWSGWQLVFWFSKRIFDAYCSYRCALFMYVIITTLCTICKFLWFLVNVVPANVVLASTGWFAPSAYTSPFTVEKIADFPLLNTYSRLSCFSRSRPIARVIGQQATATLLSIGREHSDMLIRATP